MDVKYKILITAGLLATAAGLILTIRQRARVKAFAQATIGQKEISGNLGFQSQEFERLMKEVGWHEGDQWCVYFAKLTWYNRSPDWLKPKIKKSISGSSQQTWENVSKDPAFVVSKIPKPGDMVIWQTYKNGVGEWSGHAGIVTKVGFNDFKTIEGNTNDAGSREGYTVAPKDRPFNFDVNNGLRLKGFIRFAA